MATGDFTLFEEFVNQLGSENHNFENGGDTIKLAIVDNTITPLATVATPTWTTYSANEVSTDGGYTANGITLANQSYNEADGTATLDADNISISQDLSGFTDGYWGILYNDSNGTDMAIGFVELGGPVSEASGPVAVNWNESGIFTVAIG